MNDFLKLETYCANYIAYFLNHNLLNWVSDTDKLKHLDTEVITTKKVKQYKGIYFCFYSNRLDILFKPHYYFNGNLHNANDFKIIDCINVIDEVKNIFKIDLERFKVVNIEYGLNIVSPIDIKDLITYLAYHERNEFKTDAGLSFSKKSFSTNKNGTANKYKSIKAYAKGIQFPEHCDIDTFRFEIKSKERNYIKTLGIYTALDLLDTNVYFKMIKNIIYEFEKVLIMDCTIDLSNLSIKEQKKTTEYSNPLYWYKIVNDPYRNKFSKNKILYYALLQKTGNHLKKQLEKIIFDKLELLKKGAISTPTKEIKKGAISTLYNSRICTQNKINIDEVKNSICKITGLNISMQKDDSILLSHTGLKYYYKTDKKTFEEIKRRYLSKVWINSDFEIQIKEIAHNIRNTKSNQGIKQVRIYPKPQTNFLNQLGI